MNKDYIKVHVHEIFNGEARENGKLVYIENHEVFFDNDRNLLHAITRYIDTSGNVLGFLFSDFKKSMNLPEQIFKDERTKATYGVRYVNEKIVIFSQDEGKAEISKSLDEMADKDRIQVGVQGFNYFLTANAETLPKIQSLPALFIGPGKLRNYKFGLNYRRKNNDQSVELDVKIENVFFRFFAPKLEFRYDLNKQRIIRYKGISNIKTQNGKTMNVVIDYKYS